MPATNSLHKHQKNEAEILHNSTTPSHTKNNNMKLNFLPVSFFFGLFSWPTFCGAKCPFYAHQQEGQQAAAFPRDHPSTTTNIRTLSSSWRHRHRNLRASTGDGGIPDGGFAAVKQDIRELLTDSQDFWPADFGHYGGLFIRLAWHCSGTYRDSDGRGGCDGARIRFEPEATWMDNASLDMAQELLKPIKEKYKSKLSWGDLIILAGTTAMESMGLPDPGFCGGRIDDADGADSFILGPSPEQEKLSPCLSIDMDGKCNLVEGSPMGPTTIGLIYVDPAGPVGNQSNPVASGPDIRHTFARMGFNDTETVALIGGGHAFGKCHGACLEPPCGAGNLKGIGNNTYTSGFEGKWSTTPTLWSNEFFNNLFDFDWMLVSSPGGMPQWAPNATNAPDIIMLTTDLALAEDDAYKPISQQYAADQALLETDFGAAWYRLASADMGPANRCIGEFVRPPQHWQHTLAESTPPTSAVDFRQVRNRIQALLDDNVANYKAFVNLAYQCFSTFRHTDYRGGCNGARIRFAPEQEWPTNAGTADAIATLQPIQKLHPDVSMSDMIVLAGQVAIESAGGNPQPFCPGRVDAEDGAGSVGLEPRFYDPPIVTVIDDMQVKGLTPEEAIALAGRPTGPTLTNQFFLDLLSFGESYTYGDIELQDNTLRAATFSEYQLALLQDRDFRQIVQAYADDEVLFQEEFAKAWNKIMTIDRFQGPFSNACSGVSTCTTTPCVGAPTPSPPDDTSSAANAVSMNIAMTATVAAVMAMAASSSSSWLMV